MSSSVKKSEKVRVVSQPVMVTPEMALGWLQDNVSNRQMKESVWRRYAKDMKQGFWELNGEAVKISSNGELLDGQHRLQAIVFNNKPIETFVTTGLPPETFHTLDNGRMRTAADVFYIRKEKFPTVLAACCRLLFSYEKGDRDLQKGAWRKREGISTAEVENLLKRHTGLRLSIAATYPLGNSTLVPLSVAGFAHYIFSRINKNKAFEFFNRLQTGEDMKKGHPVLTLRNYLLQEFEEGNRGRHSQTKHVALLFKTWQAFIDGEELHKVDWNRGEPFPLLGK